MKQTAMAALVIALILGAGAVLAQPKMGDGQKTMPGAQATHKGLGVVKKLDPKAGTVTFDHEPVKSLNWPAMTMAFAVRDKTLLDKLTVAKKVEFEFVQDGRGYVVTGVK